MGDAKWGGRKGRLRGYHAPGDVEGIKGLGVTGYAHDMLFKEFRIEFLHVPTKVSTSFPGILKDFSDRHDSTWDTVEYFGRMDPVAKFKNTQRTITFSFAVIADDPTEAGENLVRYQKLVRMLYPVYSKSNSGEVVNDQQNRGAIMTTAPLIGVRFANLIQQTAPTEGGHLIGYVDGFEMKPDNGMGYWHATSMDDTQWEPVDSDIMLMPGAQDNQHAPAAKMKPPMDSAPGSTKYGKLLLPKKFDIAVTFHVLHTHPLGFSDDSEWDRTAGDYPYRAEELVSAFSPNLQEKVYIEDTVQYMEAILPENVEESLAMQALGNLFGYSGGYAWGETIAADVD